MIKIKTHLVLTSILFALLAPLAPYSAEAQTAVVKNNANLRRDPSTNQAPIRLLLPPEELRLLTDRGIPGWRTPP